MKSNALIPLLFALTSAGFAQAEEANLIDPKAKAVLVKSLEAIGSKENRDKITSRRSRGTVELPAQGVSMSVEVAQEAPLKYYSKMEMPDVMTIEQGYDGKNGWAKDSIQGSRQLEGSELAQAKEGAALFFEQQLLDQLKSAEILPEVKEGEKTFTVVEASLRDGSAKTLFFDETTHLLIRIISKMAVGPEGEMTADMTASDFKEVDGVKIAHAVSVTMGPQKANIKFTEMKHNVEIDDDLFKMKK